jgi:hypothetical protein
MIHFREPRRQVRLVAQLRSGEGWCRIAITNVTTTGLRCQSPEPPAVGESVEIRFQGFRIAGSVQWCEDDEFGVVCEDTVDVELLVAGSPEVDIGRRGLPRLEVRFPARFVAGDVAVQVVVLDISPSGARLSMKAPPRRGTHGTIHWDSMECPCTVVWSAEASFGVVFGDEVLADEEELPQETEPAPAEAPAEISTDDTGKAAANADPRDRRDRRNTDRVAVDWPCEVHHADSRRAKVKLTNISTDGCVIGWFAGCREDVPLYIKMPNLSAVQAHVAWKTGQRIGCRFSLPLNRFVLEYLIGNQAA